jgi:hypothetical protein
MPLGDLPSGSFENNAGFHGRGGRQWPWQFCCKLGGTVCNRALVSAFSERIYVRCFDRGCGEAVQT